MTNARAAFITASAAKNFALFATHAIVKKSGARKRTVEVQE
jgi:hypothetical protein